MQSLETHRLSFFQNAGILQLLNCYSSQALAMQTHKHLQNGVSETLICKSGIVFNCEGRNWCQISKRLLEASVPQEENPITIGYCTTRSGIYFLVMNVQRYIPHACHYNGSVEVQGVGLKLFKLDDPAHYRYRIRYQSSDELLFLNLWYHLHLNRNKSIYHDRLLMQFSSLPYDLVQQSCTNKIRQLKSFHGPQAVEHHPFFDSSDSFWWEMVQNHPSISANLFHLTHPSIPPPEKHPVDDFPQHQAFFKFQAG